VRILAVNPGESGDDQKQEQKWYQPEKNFKSVPFS